jgi:hypothetical protein
VEAGRAPCGHCRAQQAERQRARNQQGNDRRDRRVAGDAEIGRLDPPRKHADEYTERQADDETECDRRDGLPANDCARLARGNPDRTQDRELSAPARH